MALSYSGQAVEHLRRLITFLRDTASRAPAATGQVIVEALQILERHPLVGRRVSRRLRELVISRGQSGCVALYHVDAVSGEILIVAIRHQRESGYHQDDL